MKIGIDNGIKGCAVAVLDNGDMFWVSRFKPAKPTRVFNVMDGMRLYNDLIELNTKHDLGTVEVLLEEPAINQGRGTTATSIASTAASFGRTLLVLELVGIKPENIHTCAAVTWQKFWWKTNAKFKDNDKPSIAIAMSRWTACSFVPKGCTEPDDGWSDAALMALTLSDPVIRPKFLEDEIKRAAKKVKAKATKLSKTRLARNLKMVQTGYDEEIT